MMNRLTSIRVAPTVRFVEASTIRNSGRTSMAVPKVPRNRHRSAPQNNENVKYTKSGLDGPIGRY